MGVNSRVQLSEAEIVMRKRINHKHMVNGVTFIDCESTYIDVDVEIGNDTIIYPGCVIQGNTRIKEECTLYSNSRICNSVIGSGVIVENSVILESHVGEGTTVGPFAYIRPETKIGKSARIGDFVEIKINYWRQHKGITPYLYRGCRSRQQVQFWMWNCSSKL